MKFGREVMLAAMALALGACSAPIKRTSLGELSPAQRARAVVVLLPQHEIEVDKPIVNGGGGLLGALIEIGAESVMDKHRQAAIAPLRDQLLDYDFQARFLAAVNERLVPALALEGASVTVVPSVEQYTRALQAAPERALGIRVRYAYDQNFRGVYLTMGINFGRFDAKHGAEALAPDGLNTAYHSEHGQGSAFGHKPETDYEKNAPHWGENRAAATRAALDQAIADVAGTAATDLLTPMPQGPDKIEFFTVAGAAQVGVLTCPVVNQQGDRLLLDCDWRGLYLVDRIQTR